MSEHVVQVTFAALTHVIRDRVAQVKVDEGLPTLQAMFRVEEEVSRILGNMMDEDPS